MQSVFEVTAAYASVSSTRPNSIDVLAIGKVPTGGWINASLGVWYYVSPPADGILDFDFYADPPLNGAIQVECPITACLAIDRLPKDFFGRGRDLKGVRIHAKSNKMEAGVMTLTAPAAAKASGGDLIPWPWSIPVNTGVFPLPGLRFPPSIRDPISSLPGRVTRMIRPGDPVTDDVIPDRFNIEVDKTTSRTTRVWFG